MFSDPKVAVILLTIIATNAFQLYPLVRPDAFGELLNISQNCLAALNTTLNCDPDLFRWTLAVDDVWWSVENTSTLCTEQCKNDTQVWIAGVEDACFDQDIHAAGRIVPVETVSSRYVEGFNIACMQSSSQDWCLVESQRWVGSEIVGSDCDSNSSLAVCSSLPNATTANQRIANLYEDSLLCSECFLRMMYARVTSEFLPDADYSDHLVQEFQDIQAICQTSVGELTTRNLPYYETATTTASLTRLGSSSAATSAACAGKMADVLFASSTVPFEACNELAAKFGVATGALVYATGTDDCYSPDLVCVPPPCATRLVKEGENCSSIAAAISTESRPVSVAQLATWNPHIMGACDYLRVDQLLCSEPPGGLWESPPPSSLPENGHGPVRGGPGSTPLLREVLNPEKAPSSVQNGIATTCNRYVVVDTIEASCSKAANDAGISQERLFELNPVLGAFGEKCDSQLWMSYWYCVGVTDGGPGNTTYNGTTTSPSLSKPLRTVEPSPIHPGIDSNCNRWMQAESGSTCWSLASAAGIDLSLLYQWNAVLGDTGRHCETQIWPGSFYCVGVASYPPRPDNCWDIAFEGTIDLPRFHSFSLAPGANVTKGGSMIWSGYS
ncbi:hypothetical protein BDZ85DRAFT_304804 [Elsinoe ampelina]|uniref:LysM domain-containing protein n=1 Tax=Elsinoe ampelina TaxID=302913 RepID=A0A6A6G0Y1_9PEZI|nr:hypothetical protein BDZ85DRAFT_304804 [Elsinoe ampelina]